MTDPAPDPVTRAVCRWLMDGAAEGSYNGPEAPPRHDLAALLSRESGNRDIRLAASAGWFHLEQTVRPVLESMAEAGISVWAFKGFDLARSVYPFPGGRPMRDADLFLEPRCFRKVLSCFERAGWTCMTPGDGVLSSGIVSEVKAVRHGAMVELHTHIFYFPAIFPGRLPADLFHDGRQLEPGLKGFAWHNALLMVILHMLTNRLTRPVWWADLCLLCVKVSEAGTWGQFTRNALLTRLGRSIGRILETAGALGAPVPGRAVQTLGASDCRCDAILDALRSRRGVPTLLNLKHLPGWRRVSWFHAMLWLAITRQSPLRGRDGA